MKRTKNYAQHSIATFTNDKFVQVAIAYFIRVRENARAPAFFSLFTERFNTISIVRPYETISMQSPCKAISRSSRNAKCGTTCTIFYPQHMESEHTHIYVGFNIMCGARERIGDIRRIGKEVQHSNNMRKTNCHHDSFWSVFVRPKIREEKWQTQGVRVRGNDRKRKLYKLTDSYGTRICCSVCTIWARAMYAVRMLSKQ